MKRIFAIDFIRGFAIILMILFNYSVTLTYFHVVNLPNSFLYWFVLPRIIGGIFIFISGVASYVAYQNFKSRFSERYFRRGLKLLIFAALITIFSYVFVPQETILFGILHFFAFTSFLLPLLIKFNKRNLILGIVLVTFGIYLQLTSFNFSYFLWLGFMPNNFSTFDYFPLLPWIGLLMLGIYFGGQVAQKTSKFTLKNIFGRMFTFLGKHSLTIYLLHQPLLILLLFILGYRLFF